jgi:hypothetical protein
VVVAAAEAFSVSENKSYFDGLYWAVTTITTVGYGDELPTSPEAKAMAMIVMIVGIGFFAARRLARRELHPGPRGQGVRGAQQRRARRQARRDHCAARGGAGDIAPR